MAMTVEDKIHAAQDCKDCKNFAWDKNFMQPVMQREGFFQNIVTWHHPSCPKVRR